MQINWNNTQWISQTPTTGTVTKRASASSASESTFANVLHDTVELSGYTLSFPPHNAPEALQQAYEKLSPSDKFALAATVLGMQAQANTRVVDGKLIILRPNDPGFVNIYNQPNLTVGDFLNQMKQSVLNDEKVTGYTQGREHVISLIDQLAQDVSQAGGINQPLVAPSHASQA
ncbi:MAG: hypothetical protein K6T31_02355 [Alicyclobacillus sp.]|nr:hypothetical protein [Alicyclobacillus sp.]